MSIETLCVLFNHSKVSYLNIPKFLKTLMLTNDIVNDDDYDENDGYNKTWCGFSAFVISYNTWLF